LLAVVAMVHLWPVIGLDPPRSLGGDFMAQTYPWRRYVTEELRAGRLPHWAPHQGFGFPLLADIEVSTFYPTTVLGALTYGPEPSYLLLEREMAVHLVIAGLGLFLLLRAAGAGVAGGMLGGVVFAFSGFMWAHLSHSTIIQAASWVPWVMLGGVRLLDRPTGRAVVGTGIALALSILGGHPQVSYYAGLTLAVLLLIGARAHRSPPVDAPSRRRVAGAAAAAVLLALGLAAVQLFPTAVLARRSFRWRPPAEFLWAESLPFDRLLTFLVPLAFEGTERWRHVDEFHAYVGILPLTLAGMALLLRRDRWTALFGTLAALGLVVALGVPPFARLGMLGLFRVPARAVLFCDLGLAGLAGLGAGALLRTDTARRRATDGCVRALLVALGLAILGAVWLSLAGVPGSLRGNLSPRFAVHARSLALLLAGAVLMVHVVRWLRGRRLAAWCLVVAVAIEVLTFPAHIGWSGVPPAAWWPSDPHLATLAARSGPYRVGGRLFRRAPTHEANAGLIYRLPLTSVYSSFGVGRQVEWADLLDASPTPDLLRTAGVRWLSLPRGSLRPDLVAPRDPALVESYARRGLDLWEVPDPLPRAYLSAGTRVVKGADLRTALKSLNPRREVLVERHRASCGEAARVATAEGEVRIVLDEPTRVLLQVRRAAPGPLVLSDTHHPGWTATVDGAPVPIHRANLLFRMVCVPAGTHEVEFRFSQPRFGLGLALSVLSLVVAIGVAVRR
jgi:hypothetical protein